MYVEANAVYFCGQWKEEGEGSWHVGFVRGSRGPGVSVSGVSPSEVGFMPSQLNSPFVLTFSHSEWKQGLAMVPAACFGGFSSELPQN